MGEGLETFGKVRECLNLLTRKTKGLVWSWFVCAVHFLFFIRKFLEFLRLVYQQWGEGALSKFFLDF